eukprot:1076517-Prymnesium_polylepis.1
MLSIRPWLIDSCTAGSTQRERAARRTSVALCVAACAQTTRAAPVALAAPRARRSALLARCARRRWPSESGPTARRAATSTQKRCEPAQRERQTTRGASRSVLFPDVDSALLC